MDFEWDEKKAASNAAKHGVTFTEAVEAFSDRLGDYPDHRRDYGEPRSNLVGRTKAGRMIVVTYTFRPPDNPTVCRIISTRPIYEKERKRYP